MNIYFKSEEKKLAYKGDLFELDILYITYSNQSPNHSYSQNVLHKHPHYEICAVLNGECEFELYNKKRFIVSKNSFVIFPPMCEHRIIKESESFSKLSAMFSFTPEDNSQNNFYKMAQIVINEVNTYKINPDMKFFINRFVKISDKENFKDYNTLIISNFLSFMIEAFQIMTYKKEIKIQYLYNDKRINDAIGFIENNITESLSVNDVATHLHLSCKQTSRLFLKFLSVTPGKYIQNSKIKKIRELLLNSDYSLTNIAEIMKYNDTSALIKFFKKSEGVTPQKMRDNIIKSQ